MVATVAGNQPRARGQRPTNPSPAILAGVAGEVLFDGRSHPQAGQEDPERASWFPRIQAPPTDPPSPGVLPRGLRGESTASRGYHDCHRARPSHHRDGGCHLGCLSPKNAALDQAWRTPAINGPQPGGAYRLGGLPRLIRPLRPVTARRSRRGADAAVAGLGGAAAGGCYSDSSLAGNLADGASSELGDGEQVGLVGTEGARVRESLTAKAAALRRHQLAEAETAAANATERMVLPIASSGSCSSPSSLASPSPSGPRSAAGSWTRPTPSRWADFRRWLPISASPASTESLASS